MLDSLRQIVLCCMNVIIAIWRQLYADLHWRLCFSILFGNIHPSTNKTVELTVIAVALAVSYHHSVYQHTGNLFFML
jgi:hypothetical protein